MFPVTNYPAPSALTSLKTLTQVFLMFLICVLISKVLWSANYV